MEVVISPPPKERGWLCPIPLRENSKSGGGQPSLFSFPSQNNLLASVSLS